MSNSLKSAKAEYQKAFDAIQALAAPVKEWRLEWAVIQDELAQLGDQRIEALSNSDNASADQIGAVVKAKEQRSADLVKMVEKREREVSAAVSALYDNESRQVMLATIEDVTLEKKQARDEIGRLAPEWNRANARYTRAQQIESSLTYIETEFADLKNRDQFLHGALFQLLGSGTGSDYKPSWLMN